MGLRWISLVGVAPPGSAGSPSPGVVTLAVTALRTVQGAQAPGGACRLLALAVVRMGRWHGRLASGHPHR